MTSPFKSTRSVAARRRQRPVVERSTFVVTSIGAVRVALSVEQVDRVVRMAAASEAGEQPASVMHQGRPVRVYDLAELLGRSPLASNAASRVLVVQAAGGLGESFALRVDEVRDVCAIETSLVQPVDATLAVPLTHAAVRGWFRLADDTVWVVDASRLSRVA